MKRVAPRPAGPRRAARAGRRFSLLEITLVLLIVGLALAVALPRLGRPPTAVLAADVLARLEGACHQAASLAVATGRPVRLHLDLAAGELRLDPAPATSTDPGDAPAEPPAAAPDPDQPAPPAAGLFGEWQRLAVPAFLKLADDATEHEPPVCIFYPNGEAASPRLVLLLDRRRFSFEVDRLTGHPLLAELHEP